MQHDTTQVVSCLTSVFFKILETECLGLLEFEDKAIDIGHKLIAQATGSALELFDQELHKRQSCVVRVRERRIRTRATRIGDVRFLRRICKDGYNNPLIFA